MNNKIICLYHKYQKRILYAYTNSWYDTLSSIRVWNDSEYIQNRMHK